MLKLPLHAVLLLWCCQALASSLDPLLIPSSAEEAAPQFPPSRSETSNDVDEAGRYRVASEAVHGVATRLYAVLDPRGVKNFVISPFSVAVVVGQLMLGARGASQRSLRALLSAQDDQQLHQQLGGLLHQLQRVVETEDNYYQLRTGNAFFLQTGLRVYRTFFDSVKRFYASDIYTLDFSSDPVRSYQAVNSWVSGQTNGLIKTILGGPVPPSTASLIVNTIYFRADWLTPFSSDLTAIGRFNINSTNHVQARYLRGQFDLHYAESAEMKCRLIVMPYKQKDVNMYVILPDRDIGEDVKSFADGLSWQNLAVLIESTKEYVTTVVLPKMKLQDTFSLKEAIFSYRPSQPQQSRQIFFDPVSVTTKQPTRKPANSTSSAPALSSVSVTTKQPTRKPASSTFSAPALSSVSVTTKQPTRKPASSTRAPQAASANSSFDLSGASPEASFEVEDILHRVSLEVSERGTEAAAASLGSVDYSGDIKTFKVDRPFVFFIRHEPTLVNLFWGVIRDPTAGN